VVALAGTTHAPALADRWDVHLVPEPLPVQPYHAAAGLDRAPAERVITRVEHAAEDAAAAALEAAARVTGSAVLGVAVVIKAVSVPADVMQVLRSHAAMHAAEGVLYREAVLGAARRCGWPAHAVDESALPAADDKVAALGRVAGRPWRRIEKDAARAALTLLPLEVPV
jgi:predicted nuclease with RNAse H fold